MNGEGDAICMRVTSIASRSLARSSRSFKCQCQWGAGDGRDASATDLRRTKCLAYPGIGSECNPFRSCPFLMNRAIVQSTSSDERRGQFEHESMQDCPAVDMLRCNGALQVEERGSGCGNTRGHTFAVSLREGELRE